MILGFGKNKKQVDDDIEDEDDIEYVSFQGSLDGREVNLAANARLAEAALVPTKELVTDALMRRAETIRIDPKGERAVVTLLIDGVPYSGGRMTKQQGHAVTQMAKLLSGLDIKERKKPQAGGLRAELERSKYELRIKSVPAEGGLERLTINIRNLATSLETPEEVGITNDLKLKVREMMSHRRGIFLVTGPTGTGTTTTAFALLRGLDAYQYTIYTIADRMGRELPNVVAFEVNPSDDLQASLDRAIRAEADVIFIDPLRDAETAKTMFKTQERVALMSEFLGKECRDVAHALAALVKLVGDPQVVADGLQGIISQKLIRMLCQKCRAAYRPHPKLVAKVGLPPETRTLWRPPPRTFTNERGEEVELEPCDVCGGIGYRGRAAMFELIEMTDGMRAVLTKKGTPQEIKSQARAEKMLTLQREGLRLVVEGKTSLEELQRVFQAKQAPKK